MALRSLRGISALAVAAATLVAGAPALALQPLEAFLSSARQRNPDAVIADATVRQRDAEVSIAHARLLPSFSARGTYTRNQYESVISLPGGEPITVTPQDQLDAFFTLNVPIIDLAQYSRYDAQKLSRELAQASASLTDRQLDERVVRGYYTLTATVALIETTSKSLRVAEDNLRVVKERVDAGASPLLDLERAKANLERAKQDIADAELSRALSTRALETVSRLTPETVAAFPQDDLHPEAPLDAWMRVSRASTPEARIAQAELKVAEANRRTSDYAYAPVLSAQAQERLTNATGFSGNVATYTLSATLSWQFDFGLPAQQDLAQAGLDATRAREDRSQRSVDDAVVEAWHRVVAGIAKSRAARAQLKATETAARMASERYESGIATQLDVTQAQRDAFAADVARIQADLDLIQARALLRLAAGTRLNEKK